VILVITFNKIIFSNIVAVGKSCILLQFNENKFREQHEITIGAEFAAKIIELDGKFIKIQVWDTAGHEAFQSITKIYYRGAVGALLVYDITRRDTYIHLIKWLSELKENAPKDITIILIGNKNDLENERQVSYEEGESFAKENGLLFLETSAKTANNIIEAFNLSAMKILNNIQKNKEIIPKKNIKIEIDENNKDVIKNSKQDNKKGCC
jgi:Ras-related protein Rab-2A